MYNRNGANVNRQFLSMMFPPTVLSAVAMHATHGEAADLAACAGQLYPHFPWMANISAVQRLKHERDDATLVRFIPVIVPCLWRFLELTRDYDCFYHACERNLVDVVKMMLSPTREGDVESLPFDVRSEDNESLMESCIQGNLEVVRVLLSPVKEGGAGLGPDDARVYNNYALRRACAKGDTDMVRLLFTPAAEGGAGLGPDDARARQNEALIGACRAGNLDVVRLLLTSSSSGGGGLDVRDIDSSDAIWRTFKEGNHQIAQYLEFYKESVS